MQAEPGRRRDLVGAEPGELPLRLQRELWLLVDALYDADDDGTLLGEAVAKFAFDHELLYVPATESMARDGLRFYPVAPHELRTVYVVRPASTIAASSAPTRRRPSLRDLGAQPIDDAGV